MDPNAEAVRWFRLAADQGLAEAQSGLGHCYKEGIGVAENAAEAVYWYRLAADQGYDWAQNYLGEHYEEGRGVAKDIHQSLEWYQRAATQGHERAKDNLADLLQKNPGLRSFATSRHVFTPAPGGPTGVSSSTGAAAVATAPAKR